MARFRRRFCEFNKNIKRMTSETLTVFGVFFVLIGLFRMSMEIKDQRE